MKHAMRQQILSSQHSVEYAQQQIAQIRDEQIDKIEDMANHQISMMQYSNFQLTEILRILTKNAEPERKPVIDVVGIVEMKIGLYDQDYYDLNIDNRDDLTDLLEPYNGKRVRVTVEVIEEENEPMEASE